jgi:pimeloyl-ACP methyl ester carboxylesterase
MHVIRLLIPTFAGVALLLAGCEPHGFTRTTPAGAIASGEEPAGAKQVTFKTADGWTIVGDRYVPSGKPKGGVILLHQRGGKASDWVPLCRALQKAGIEALAIDQRGAGRSTEGTGGTGDEAPWETGGDIAAAFDTFTEVGYVGLAGASYGANNALIYAGAHPQQIHSLALFSPGANYHGLNALQAAHAFRGAVVIYHDRNDEIAGNGPAQIEALLAGKDKKLRLYPGSDHGTALLTPEVVNDCVHFFLRTLK